MTEKLRLPKLTFLVFQLNYLLDRSYYNISIHEAKEKVRNRTLFDFLEKRTADDYLDLSIFDKKDRDNLMDRFEGFADNIDEDRKMGVQNNGLCLLLAYVIEIIQEDYVE